MTSRIGIYIGTANDDTENVEKVLRSWGEYLSESYEIDAFGSATLPDSCSTHYNYLESPDFDFSTPFGKLRVVHRQCDQYLRDHSPDILVQLWKFNTHATGVTTAAQRHDIPSIVRYSGATFQSYQSHQGLRQIGSFFLNNVLNQWLGLQLSDSVIVLGPNGQRAMTNRGVDSGDTIIVPPALDSEGRFHPVDNAREIRDELGLPSDRRIALYVGRISEKKGVPFLMSVVEKLLDSDILFLVVGEGPEREKLGSFFDDSVLRTVGHVPYSDIDMYYKASDLYVHPSAYEGVPLVILEALECGVPVVARRAGDVEFITPNVFDDPGEMAVVIRQGSWEDRWLNREYFDPSFQQEQLTNTIQKLVK